MQNKRVFGLMTAAGCALFAASAMGAASTVLSEGFESPATDGAAVTTLANWTGYGTVTASNYTSAVDSTVGRPIGPGSPNNVLVVEGRVTRSAIGTSNTDPATVDMMVQIALPDDALAFPSNTDQSGIQIAVGVETNATLKIYCKNKSNAANWYSLGTTAYAVGSWHRVSFTFDYGNGVCQVRVDGEPILTENGYFSNNVLANTDITTGSWYKLANSAANLSSVEVIGSTAIDDLLVKDDAGGDVNSVLPALADANSTNPDGVKYSWIEEQGITRTQAEGNALDYTTTGMTVAQKYVAGYDVADGKKFGVKEMTLSNTVATVTFDPANVKTGYSYVLSTSTDMSTWSDALVLQSAETAAGTVSVTLDAPVKYLRLKVVQQ